MEFLVRALSGLQPVPEEWEALFLAGGALALALGVVTGVKSAKLPRRIVVPLVLATFAALMGQSVLNKLYTHTFQPDVAAGNVAPVVLAEPFTGCSRLDAYTAAIGEHEVLSADEWRLAVDAGECKGATVGTVIAIALGFFVCVFLIGVVFTLLYLKLAQLSPSLLQSLLRIFWRPDR